MYLYKVCLSMCLSIMVASVEITVNLKIKESFKAGTGNGSHLSYMVISLYIEKSVDLETQTELRKFHHKWMETSDISIRMNRDGFDPSMMPLWNSCFFSSVDSEFHALYHFAIL